MIFFSPYMVCLPSIVSAAYRFDTYFWMANETYNINMEIQIYFTFTINNRLLLVLSIYYSYIAGTGNSS